MSHSRAVGALPVPGFHRIAIHAVLTLLLAAVLPLYGQRSAPARRAPAPSKAESVAAEKEPEKLLAQLARALRDEESAAAYARLSQFAQRHAASELGARAALALGYHDFTKGRAAQAERWLEKAQREALLREYVLYWLAQANCALGRNAEALAQLETLRREFPESVMIEQALAALGETALRLDKAGEAVAALEKYDKVASRPALLLLRARAREKSDALAAAARDYLAVYYRFPLSDEADAAGKQIPALARRLGEAFPGTAMDLKLSRAAALYDARRWREARAEYEKLLHELRRAAGGAELERAELRSAQARLQSERGGRAGTALRALASLSLTGPELDAERLSTLAQFHRGQKQESKMLGVVEQLAARHPQGRWTDDALFVAGNFFWGDLDRGRANLYYRRVLEQFPAGKNAPAAHWRLAWVTYLERRPEAAALLEEHLRRFPGSVYTANALYWLGRQAERRGDTEHARGFYLKVQERWPQTYFGRQSAERLLALGTAPANAAEFLALIPSLAPLPQLDEAIPPAAGERWARAQGLRAIAFDASAELELRAAYAATWSPRLLWEAARAALDAGRPSVAITLARQLFPQLEARRMEEVPTAVWRTVFPLPFEASLRRAAARRNLDPMLLAGLIRQESVFQADAVSRAGAVGLMQVLPKTGRKLAARLKLPYARARLFHPEYNLQLGTLYLAGLAKMFGNTEAALAAYNAGEERVTAWQAERSFEEPAEFVESIPFTETREYVQIVMRNADVYRRLYGKAR